jgi:hypothetical protein
MDFPVDAPATRTLLEALCRNFFALSSFHFCRLKIWKKLALCNQGPILLFPMINYVNI